MPRGFLYVRITSYKKKNEITESRKTVLFSQAFLWYNYYYKGFFPFISFLWGLGEKSPKEYCTNKNHRQL